MGNINTKERLLDSALGLFVAKGIAETTIKDIAHLSGVTDGAIYRHFPSKESLTQELFDRHLQALAADLEEILTAQAASTRMKVTQIVTHMCRLYDDNPTLYRFLLLIQHNALPRAAARNPATLLRNFIQCEIAGGRLPAQDAALSAAMLLGLILQPTIGLIHGSRTGTMLEVAPAITAAALSILLISNSNQ